ncbi:MAG: coniferyl aldehyde dehydrogenase [Gammaproteobacteria bacterium]|nr:coniferyl aldehyde dehydrogenase [Gammaproteobacteria bacterium]MDH5628750.1 coniferyl aldehyde dehydrogenase [Gammaproteobacteria bacterium]
MPKTASKKSLDVKATHKNEQLQIVHEIFELQQTAFKAAPYPSESLRKQQLKALKKSILKHKDKLLKATSADFGCRSYDETLLADILPTIMGINHALKHLRQWMKTEKRKIDLLYQPAQGYVMYQPLGVVGIISPWNYPTFLSLGPMVAALAAGNRVMLKPSEFSPYTNRILKDIISEAFSKDEVYMIEGDATVAQTFTSLPFDHLIYTGSTSIGRKVMEAAAKNLTPVTLELGGKSPAIVAPDIDPKFAVERMIFGKCLNAGQTCVATDYVLCPEEKQDDLIAAFKTQFSNLYPDLENGQYTSIINDTHFKRVSKWLKEAVDKGAKAIELGKTASKNAMPLTLLTDVDPDSTIMQEEIFGPILPIVTYKSIDEAIEFIQSRPRPLALYIFSFDKKVQDKILKSTHAGGVCINETVYHVAQDNLPFGGIGASGIGHYHAKEGFITFSKAKSIFRKGRFNSGKFALPPYGKLIHKLIYRFYLKS